MRRLFSGKENGGLDAPRLVVERRSEFPILPLRDSVALPHSVGTFTIGRPSSLALLEALPVGTQTVVLVCQREATVSEPRLKDLHPIGTLGRILEVSRVKRAPPSAVLFVGGMARVRLLTETQREPYLKAIVEVLEDVVPDTEDAEYLALRRNVHDLALEIIEASPVLSNELVAIVESLEDASGLADFVTSVLPGLRAASRQLLLETLDVRARMRQLVEILVAERENLRLQAKLQEEVRAKIGGAQREFFLREQLKAIQKELGEEDEGSRDVAALRARLAEITLPDEARAEVDRELGRLGDLSPASPEYGVARTFLDWVATLPWTKTTAQPVDLRRAAEILDEDHFDLERVKARMVEYLAVLQLKADVKGPILCFVGPPGVGKTSLGKSIARALGRAFARLSLGGMHDEAEIRGHRRTYVGALPGQILRALRRAGSRDPVFMLDEIDKLGRDFHGDPAAALLEVLDPEQNATFRDHYLDLAFDLSRVLFITTANVTDPVPPALRDRMEVLELPGYTEEQKLGIARRFLVPKQIRENGLEPEIHLSFGDDALRAIVRSYTMEAGVRNLEREIGSLCRKHARRVASGPTEPLVVTPEVVRRDLGVPRVRTESALAERTRAPGVAVALAWTPVGGDILFVEATRMPRDTGEFTITGQVGEVMQESMVAAMSWVRANGPRFGIDPGAYAQSDVHVHVPSGAVPKDGPSAGVVIVTALVSMFTGRPVRPFLALTGEITLTGHVLPVGGIKEKLLVARRAGVQEVVLPAENEDHVRDELSAEERAGLGLHFVRTLDEALALALGPAPAVPHHAMDQTECPLEEEADATGPVAATPVVAASPC